jgi:hypothetical protein
MISARQRTTARWPANGGLSTGSAEGVFGGGAVAYDRKDANSGGARWSLMTNRRIVALMPLLALAATVSPGAATFAAVRPPIMAQHSVADAVGTGGVAINGSASATASATVTMTVPPPYNAFGTLRLSNDGGSTWVERRWATSIAWSLIEVAGYVHLDAVDGGVGLARTEVSLDDVHWRSLNPSPFTFYFAGMVDLREGTIGGSWAPGEHTIYTRAVDKLGNVSEAPPLTKTPTSMRLSLDPPATFTFPLPPVAGQPFTIQPTFDAGYHLAAGEFCQWRLLWGTANVRLEAGYDETYGEVMTSVAAKNGVCEPWTFTLPYTPPLEYTWSLSINPSASETLYITSVLAGSFRAAPGGTSRAISSSSIPLFYLLPDRQLVGATGTVIYHLHTAGGATAAAGWWSCFPADRTPETAQTDQYGGTSFTCPVTTSEPWTAFWAREAGGKIWRAGYDPIGDRSRPTVGSLRVAPAPGAWLTTTTVNRISWSGKDKGSGLHHYTLQVSRNGGAWTAVALPSRLTTSFERSATVGVAYRYRVRATDRAGNTGAWTYSATFRPTAIDDGSSQATWAWSWTRIAASGAVGGHVRTASLTGAAVTFRFTGSGVGIVAPRAPGQGFAQVYVDGVLTATIDLGAPSPTASRVVWSKSWPTAGSHVVRIRNLATTGRPAITIDAFSVLR